MSPSPAGSAGGQGLRRQERVTALVVAAALFMQNLDGTVIATALPAMARDFGEDAVRLNIALTAYLFTVALCVPASGWLADRFGPRRIFVAAITIFTLGSLLCGASSSLAELVAARLVQGAGGALMVPVGRLVLLRTVPQERMVAAMAWVTVPGLVGPVVGPPIGGFIATYANWRMIFDLNLPVGVLGAWLAWRSIAPRTAAEAAEAHPGALDWLGLLLSGAGLACAMAVLELAGRGAASPAVIGAIALVGVLAGVVYVRRARGQARPLLDFSLLHLAGFRVSVISGSLFRIGVGAVPFLLPLTMQLGFGRSAAQSGMITFAAALGAIVSKAGTQISLRRFGFRRTLVANALLSAAGLASYAAFRPAWPVAAIYLVLFITGFLRSLQFTAYNTIAYEGVERARLSAATTLYSAIQQVSLTVGIPISAAVLNAFRPAAGPPGLAAFSSAFLVIAALSALAAPAAMLLPPGAGDVLAGRARRPLTVS